MRHIEPYDRRSGADGKRPPDKPIIGKIVCCGPRGEEEDPTPDTPGMHWVQIGYASNEDDDVTQPLTVDVFEKNTAGYKIVLATCPQEVVAGWNFFRPGDMVTGLKKVTDRSDPQIERYFFQ